MLIICANNLKQLTNNIYIFIDMRALGGGARRRQCWRAARKLCATGAAARARADGGGGLPMQRRVGPRGRSLWRTW